MISLNVLVEHVAIATYLKQDLIVVVLISGCYLEDVDSRNLFLRTICKLCLALIPSSTKVDRGAIENGHFLTLNLLRRITMKTIPSNHSLGYCQGPTYSRNNYSGTFCN